MKDVTNLFRLKNLKKKETNDATFKDIRSLFRLEKQNKTIKDIIIRGIRNLSEYEEEDYYKPVRVDNFWSKNYIEYKSKGDRKTISFKKRLNKIIPYLKDIINNLKKSDTCKYQLTITTDFISSKNENDEGRVIHSKSDNNDIMINDKTDEVLEEYDLRCFVMKIKE